MDSFEYLQIALAAAPLFVLVLATKLDAAHSLLSPFWGIMFPVFIGCFMKVVASNVAPDPTVVDAFSKLSISDVFFSIQIILLFTLCTAVGYFVLYRRPTESQIGAPRLLNWQVDGMAALAVTLVLSAIAAAALVKLLSLSGATVDSFGAISAKRYMENAAGQKVAGAGYRLIIQSVRINSLVLLAIWWRFQSARRNVGVNVAIGLGLASTAIESLVLSQRSELVLLMIPIVGVLKYERVLSWWQIAVTMVCCLLFANTVVSMRSGSVATLSDLPEATYRIVSNFSKNSDGPDVVKIARIREFTRQSGKLLYGERILKYPVSLIPRSLWKNKPTDLDMGHYMTSEVFGLDPHRYGFFTASLIGECYLNAAWIGIAMGGILYGAVLRCFMIYVFPQNETSSAYTSLLFLIAFPSLTYLLMMGDIALCINTMIRDAFVATILYYVYSWLAIHRRNRFNVVAGSAGNANS